MNKYDLYDDLFFPFQTRFFHTSFSDSELSDDLKAIASLFSFSDNQPQNCLIAPPVESATSTLIITDPPSDDSLSILSLRMINNNQSNDHLISIHKEDDSETNLVTDDNYNYESGKGETHVDEKQIKQITSVFDKLSLSEFNRTSLDKWLFFHRKLFDMENGQLGDLASQAWPIISKHIESSIQSVPNSPHIWWYGERVFSQLKRSYTSEKWDSAEITDQHKDPIMRSDTIVEKIRGITNVIKDILRRDKGIESVVYYTSLHTLSYLFEKDDEGSYTLSEGGFQPQIMSVSTMNDPEEGHILQGFLSDDTGREHKYWWNSISELDAGMQPRYFCTEPYVFCKSFTNMERFDDLSMWEIYGDRAEGCCCKVEIDTRSEKKTANDEYCLYNIAYIELNDSPGVVQIGSEKDSSCKKIELLNICLAMLKGYIKQIGEAESPISVEVSKECRKEIMSITYLFKANSYSHENEIRYLDTHHLNAHPDSDIIKLLGELKDKKSIPFLSVKSNITFQYKEVILGPKIKNPDIAAAYLKYRFETSSNNSPHITKSVIRYR